MSAATLDVERRAVNHLLPYLKNKLLIDITMADIRQFIDAKLAAGITPRGVNMKLGTLRAILRRNHLWEPLRPDFTLLKEPKNQGKALTPSEDTALLAACRNSISRVLYPAAALARYAAMRHDEIRLLQWSQIDLDKAYLIVGASKTIHGEGRVVPLIGPAHEALIDWAAAFPNRQPSHYVFPRERYAFNPENGFTTVYRHDPTKAMGAWKKAWEAARRLAGVNVRFHDLRHTCITRWLERGMTIQMIAAIVGWSSSTMNLMSLRYGHFSVEALRAAMIGPGSKQMKNSSTKPASRRRRSRLHRPRSAIRGTVPEVNRKTK